MKFEFTGTVDEGGKLKIAHQKMLTDVLRTELAGKHITLTIEKKRVKRTLPQNAYLHVLFTLFSVAMIDLTGDRKYTKDYMKRLCKAKFLTVDEVDERTGELLGPLVRDTHELSKEEFAVFVDQIIEWAATVFGIVLPVPNEQFSIAV